MTATAMTTTATAMKATNHDVVIAVAVVVCGRHGIGCWPSSTSDNAVQSALTQQQLGLLFIMLVLDVYVL